MSYLHNAQAHRLTQKARAEMESYRMKTTRRHGVVVALVTSVIAFGLPRLASAQGLDLGMDYASSFGLGTGDIRDTAGNLIRSLLSLLGFVLVVMVLYSGMQMLLAGGDEERASAAKTSLRNAVVGFIIIMMSVSITKFVVNAISGASGGTTYLY